MQGSSTALTLGPILLLQSDFRRHRGACLLLRCQLSPGSTVLYFGSCLLAAIQDAKLSRLAGATVGLLSAIWTCEADGVILPSRVHLEGSHISPPQVLTDLPSLFISAIAPASFKLYLDPHVRSHGLPRGRFRGCGIPSQSMGGTDWVGPCSSNYPVEVILFGPLLRLPFAPLSRRFSLVALPHRGSSLLGSRWCRSRWGFFGDRGSRRCIGHLCLRFNAAHVRETPSRLYWRPLLRLLSYW
mmetsp:Transcript_53502/g.96341  ORF Transcript_53502/g.96341 Transcript_53502/m.96341 type:complete len:242 (-) Transcript_53502:69-794(-)